MRRIAEWMLACAGVLVIALALVLGAFRLLIGLLPGYQAELRAWVATELGVEAEFAELNARLGLLGPELDLRDARLQLAAAGQQFLAARSASVTLDPWALVFRGQVAIARLTLDGVRLSLERTAAGELRVQGLEGGTLAGGILETLFPPSIDVVIRDSQILYIDRPARHSWQFADLDVALERGSTGLTVAAQARPPAELGARIALTAARAGDAESPLVVAVELAGFDLAALGRMLPPERVVPVSGRGDLKLGATWNRGRADSITAAVALEDVAVGSASDATRYQRLALSAEWQPVGAAGFELTIDDLALERDGRAWPAGSSARIALDRATGVVELAADFVRLEDLAPVVAQFAPADVASRWVELAPAGDLSAVQFASTGDDVVSNYALEGAFTGLTFASSGQLPGISGLSGEIRAGTEAGTIRFRTAQLGLDWPALLAAPVGAGDLRGTVLWRRGRDGLRVVSNDLRLELFGEPLVASFDLGLPADGTSPYLDASARMDSIAVLAAKQLLPVRILPVSVASWLQSALFGGIARDVSVEFVGPLQSFPFDAGEGRFVVEADVENGGIEFVTAWPRAEQLNGRVRFENAGFAAAGSGRILGSAADDVSVVIADMRAPLLEIDAAAAGPLADVLTFVQTAPLIARHLGAGFDRLHAEAGEAVTTIDLDLPLKNFSAFQFAGRVAIDGGGLSIDGFGPQATDISGALDIRNSLVSGDRIEALFLGGPATARVRPAEVDGYRTVLEVDGETSATAILDAFSLPFRDLLDGQTLWSGRLWLPHTQTPAAGELKVEIESNLSGIALRFPDPLAKSPGEPVNLQLGITFDDDSSLGIAGNLGATRRFEFELGAADGSFRLERGAVAFGGDEPMLPLRDGIVVSGRIPHLRLDDWLELARSSSIERARPLFYSAKLDVAEFEAYGQMLGMTRLDVQRGDRVWDVAIESAAIAGRIEVPQDLSYRTPVIAEMDRVYLAVGDQPGDFGRIDPRRLPGLRLRSAEFGFGSRELGRVEADVVADPLGLRLTTFSGATESFEFEAIGSWLGEAGGTTSRIEATVRTGDVATTLDQLGIDPVVEGETGELTARLHWAGGPGADWLDHLNGEVTLRIETGSLIEIDPGAGRVVGLMSIAALPRRLLLDFRDVFNKGFVFDEITGSFEIIDGNAFTDDLKLSGPTAEIGVIGRTGLRDRDYQQQAVVTSEPSNMLPTVGGILGGPGVGAALLIFTRIFKEPLKGIGRASYCVTGSWDAPVVERIESGAADQVEQCAALPRPVAEENDGG